MRSRLEKLDTAYMHNITCPHCGWEDTDSWEFDESQGEIDCGGCEETFYVYRDIEVSYSSITMEEKLKNG